MADTAAHDRAPPRSAYLLPGKLRLTTKPIFLPAGVSYECAKPISALHIRAFRPCHAFLSRGRLFSSVFPPFL